MNKILSLVKKFYQASFFGRRASKKKERSREPGQNPKPANRWFLRLTNKEQIFFVKRLSFLTRAGVPILESLRMLRHFRSKQKTRLFDRVIGDVENGQSLATSLAKFDYVFGNFAVNIIRVGESAGILDQNLNYLADELKKKQELRHKIISALVYPGFIVLATLGIVTLLLTFVFPKVLPVFSSLKMTLPWSTRFLIAASNFIIKDGLFLLAGAALAVIIFLVFLRKSRHFIFFS